MNDGFRLKPKAAVNCTESDRWKPLICETILIEMQSLMI